MTFRDLDPDDLHELLQSDPSLHLLDVRTEPEHASHRLPDATLIPVQELHDRVGELDADKHWVVYCEHGRRSVYACELLAQSGFAQLTNMRGGMAHWIGKGLPFDRGA